MKRVRSLEYMIWQAMLDRCYRQANHAYSYYGGRGIKVCQRWHSFELFSQDMLPRPTWGTLERKNNNGDYEPSNCIWATRSQQQRNRRDSIMVTVSGVTKHLYDWAEEAGMPPSTIRNRLKRGIAPELAIVPNNPRRYQEFVDRFVAVLRDHLETTKEKGKSFKFSRTDCGLVIGTNDHHLQQRVVADLVKSGFMSLVAVGTGSGASTYSIHDP